MSMSKRNRVHIKNLISKVGIEKAPDNFAKNVMQDIFVSTNEEALKDAKLTSVLKQATIETPSNIFVSNIMNEIETKRNIQF